MQPDPTPTQNQSTQNQPSQNQPTPATNPQQTNPDLIGQWSGTDDSNHSKITVEFTADSIKETAEIPTPGSTQPIKGEIEGTYKLDGTKMTVKTTKMHVSSDDPKLKEQLDTANKSYSDDYISKQPAVDMSLFWKDKDTLDILTKKTNGEIATFNLKRGAPPATDTTPTAATPPATSGGYDQLHRTVDSYIQDAQSRSLTESEVRSWKREERFWVRNGLFAMHGAMFAQSSPAVPEFFHAYPWYNPNVGSDSIKLPQLEDDNAKLISSVEKALAQEGTPIYKPGR